MRQGSRRLPGRRAVAAATALGLASAAALSYAPPATAAIGTDAVVTMFSEAEEYVGMGQQRIFHRGDSTIRATINAENWIVVTAAGGTYGDAYEFQFAPPDGEQLHVGLYEGAQRAPFADPGRAGINVDGMHRGCNRIWGRFDIKDLVISSGQVARLWLTYEQHCEEIVPALFGEVRIGVPSVAGAVMAPRIAWWPDLDPHRRGTTTPLTFVATGTTTITGVALEGPGASHFEIVEDDCASRTLSPGGQCAVWTRFAPSAAGPKVAALRFSTSAGTHRIALDGRSPTGRTRWDQTSDAGHYVGQGGTYSYTTADALIVAAGSPSSVWTYVVGDDGVDFGVGFTAPYGSSLTAGATYTGATRVPEDGGPALDATTTGRGCNFSYGQFTVHHARFGPHEELIAFGASYEHHCESITGPVMTGTIEWRVPHGDVSPPGRVTHLTATRSGDNVSLSWTNPTASDLATIIVRRLPGSMHTTQPNASVPTYAGSGSSTSVASAGAFTATVFAVDAAGNVGPASAIFVPGSGDSPGSTTFSDIADSPFRADIEWLVAEGITFGCSPDRFCPVAPVTREQMASFLVRALHLPPAGGDFFVDDESSIHEADINRLAASGITRGCAADRFCPRTAVTREQMAAFLRRAMN